MPSITISDSQINAFEESMLQGFYLFMLDHIRQNETEKFLSKSDEEIIGYVKGGIKRAQVYGATSQTAYGMFISTMLLIGDDFDTNGQYPWAETALKDVKFKDPNDRMNNLMVQVTLFLHETEDIAE